MLQRNAYRSRFYLLRPGATETRPQTADHAIGRLVVHPGSDRTELEYLTEPGRVLINRPAVSAFGQSGHWSRHRRMTESDPKLRS
jgi:hypothetical protein